MSFIALDKTTPKIAPTASFRPLQVTPAAKVTPTLLQTQQTGQPVNFSQINNTGPVFSTTPKPGFNYGPATPLIGGAAQMIKAAAEGGAGQVQSGINEAGEGLNTGNPIKMGEGTLNTLAGIINLASAPIAPAFQPLGEATNYLGQKLGSHYSDNPILPNDTATRIVQAIANAANIYGAIAGPKAGEIPEPVKAESPPEVAIAPKAEPIAPTVSEAPKPQLIQDIKPPQAKAEAPLETSGAPKTVGRTTQTLKPIEGTGAIKTRGLSEGVEATAIEKKLTDNLGDLPEYRQVSMKEQATKAADLITKDPEAARAIAMGEKAPPKGILPESVYVAAEHKATVEGDVQTLKDLANSKLAASATTMGQRIRTLGERDSASPVAAIQEIQKARAASQASRSESVPQTVEKIRSSIRNTNTKQTWGDFVNSITC